ncbi:hypothetical protein ACFSC6_08990 [Rufibacter sediminis]|uniref:DprA winged helix domain-containing protein n=2 Tax=Rufibacter sediminis TaxID=2762756 RepID=A0ABR6VYK0_9BACT|nr:hypothetical protein [Rufibacter sediminis]MBC3541972.1 hypothetical protein [Rufibacter sediminis]
MDKRDLILADLFAQVKCHHDPEDHPTSTSKIATDIDVHLDEVLLLCQELAQEGFLKISPLNSPPLVYLTVIGIARARRLDTIYSTLGHRRTC